ncbi:MAG: aminoglycoside phosphotransferase family protein [Nannocystaceae bacterium]
MVTWPCILAHPSAKILVDCSGLPEVTCSIEWFPAAVGEVAHELFHVTGLRCRPLRFLATGNSGVWVVEVLDSAEPNQNGRWRWISPKRDDTLSNPEHRYAVAAWLSAQPIAPWQHPGWGQKVTAWVSSKVRSVGSPQEIRGGWPCSCVLRFSTKTGSVYFKADSADGPGEPCVLQKLSPALSSYLPEVIALDCDQRWLLLQEFEPIRPAHVDPKLCADALRRTSQVLRNSGPAADWRELGCQTWDATALRKVANTIPQLATRQGPLDHALLELETSRIAPTLLHCDLHPWNLGRRAGKTILFDWGDVAVGHPFFALVRLFDHVVPAYCDAQTLEEAIVASWSEGYDEVTVRAELSLIQRLHWLFQTARWVGAAQHAPAKSPWRAAVDRACAGTVAKLIKNMAP